MSYYSWVHLHYVDSSEIDPSELVEPLAKHLDAVGISRDVCADVADLFTKGEATFKLYGGMIVEILGWVSAQRPAIPFGVQGRGEELRDVWVREFAEGQVSYSQGPFE
jgi:hypothetical protein